MNDLIVDVLIPTYKPNELFEQLIRRLIKQKYPIRKIYVINTQVGDFPDELCKKYSNIHVTHIERSEFDHGGTRARGARMSDADILVFMTQDAVPVDDLLITNLVKPFCNSKTGITYARQLATKTSGRIERYTRSFNYPGESKIKTKRDIPGLGIKAFFCSNVCAAYRNSIYRSLDGFPEKTIFNEDMIMAWKILQAGYHIVYTADAEVIHSHNYSGKQQFKRNFDLGVSQRENEDIFEVVSSEQEGIKLVKKTAMHLLKIKRPWLILSLIWKSGCKYMGYFMGQRYHKLPRWMVLRCTTNPDYWM